MHPSVQDVGGDVRVDLLQFFECAASSSCDAMGSKKNLVPNAGAMINSAYGAYARVLVAWPPAHIRPNAH